MPPKKAKVSINQTPTNSVDADEAKKAQGKRALCWSILALSMSIPALIGA